MELHGCGIASETHIVKSSASYRKPKSSELIPGTFTGKADGRGLVYLKRVASVFGAQVVGAVNVQEAGPNNWRFEGDTVTVFPNGKFRLDSDTTRPFDQGAKAKAAMDWLVRIEDTMIKKRGWGKARESLKELIEKYPTTNAAARARSKLSDPNLEDNAGLGGVVR